MLFWLAVYIYIYISNSLYIVNISQQNSFELEIVKQKKKLEMNL